MASRHEAQLGLLAKLASLKLPLFLMGGFAEDALLGQEITRERADIDFLVESASWESVRVELEAQGIEAFEPRFSGPDGQTLAFASHIGNLEVEVWLGERAGEGYAIVLPGKDPTAGSQAFFQLLLSPDTFSFPPVILEDMTVQTISPRALCLFRAASAQTRGDAQRQRADLEMLERLRGMYLRDVEPTGPQITELS